jgi:hypothetical protein
VLEQGPAGAGYQLHHRLIGLDLGKHVAYGHGLAFLLFPFNQAALLHSGRESFHYDFRRHASVSL